VGYRKDKCQQVKILIDGSWQWTTICRE
jgi:hypothetical protein